MKAQLKTIAVVALVAPVMAACATKGFVRENLASGLATQKAYTDSSVSTERTARMAADSSLSTDVASLRKDLDSLRTEFGAKITALESGLQFAMPVHFAFDDATVRDEDHDALDRFAKIAQKYYPGSNSTVEGFADPAGSPTRSRRPSRRRVSPTRSLPSAMARRASSYPAPRRTHRAPTRTDAWCSSSRARVTRRPRPLRRCSELV